MLTVPEAAISFSDPTHRPHPIDSRTSERPGLDPLPIDKVLPEICRSLEARPNLVLRASTGAGKTTRVPPSLLPLLAPQSRLIMLEPRRVAARAAARRIAEEQGWRLGEEVGYQVRFDRAYSRNTRLLVVTEGILVQMLQRDPFLERVGMLVFDEFHERSLHSDLALAMARKVQLEVREDLRIVVMSATLEPSPIVSFLGSEERCTHLESDGRLHPVRVEHLPRPDGRALPTLVREGVERALQEIEGDVLVFLPGVGEIRRCQEILEPVAKRSAVDIKPLYGDLPAARQDAVLRKGAGRKVVLATNVAETSITVDGVTAVVDSGLVRTLRFDPGLGLDRLELGRISRDSALQRQGRAGRQAPGLCLKLWSEHDERSFSDHGVPEISRVDLGRTMLELLAWGESDPASFPWFEAPDTASLGRALRLLEDLGARAASGLTPLGRELARIPLHPRLGRLLVEGRRRGVSGDAALLAALISERDVVFRPVGHRRVVAMTTAHSDPLDRLEAIREMQASGYGECALGPVDPGRSRHVLRVAEHLRNAARSSGNPGETAEPSTEDRATALLRCLLSAYPDRVAKRREKGSRRVLMVGGRGGRLAEMSAVHEAELMVCVELEGGGGRDRSESLIRQASAIEESWLEPIEEENRAIFDSELQRVVGRRIRSYRGLSLVEKEAKLAPAEAETVLAEAARAQLTEALALDASPTDTFLLRIRSLRQWMPELELPAFDEDDLHRFLPMLVAGKRSFAELQRLPLIEILRGGLDFRQSAALDEHAPERIAVPSGSQIRLQYRPGLAPVLAVRIQEIFGLHQTPRVGGGRIPVLLHLLAPNMRPQQVTDDLESFWSSTYREVRKDLAGRYPKHAWPEDPLSAEPMRGARRRR